MSHDQLFEYIATACGLLNIFLITRQSNWNFFFGFINALCFFFLFHHKKIYADMGLHVVYMAFQVYGFYHWRIGGTKHQGVSVYNANKRELSIAALVIVALGFIMAFILSRYTDSTSIPLDASSTAICLVAQWMMSKKWLQNWWLWLIADSIAIIMYVHKGLYVTTGLYAVYIVMCVIGLMKWRNALKTAN
jgi:nicotinamide mononucleotide transporter